MSTRHQKFGSLPGAKVKAWRAERALLQTWVTPEVKAQIEALAKDEGLTVAAFLRRMIFRRLRP